MSWRSIGNAPGLSGPPDEPELELAPYEERLLNSPSYAGLCAEERPDTPIEECVIADLHQAMEALSGWRCGNLREQAEACDKVCREFERDDAAAARTVRTFEEHRADLESALRTNRDMASLINGAIFKRVA